MQKTFYPNLKSYLCITSIYIVLIVPLLLFVYNKLEFWIWLCFLLFFISLLFVFIIGATCKLQISDALYYKHTIFSKTKKVDITNINKIVFNFKRNKTIDIYTKDNKEIYFDISCSLMKELLLLKPEKIFKVNYLFKFNVSRKYRKFLLNTNILSKEQRKELLIK